MTTFVETKDIWKNEFGFCLYPSTGVKKAKRKKKKTSKEGKQAIGVHFCKIIKN